MSIKLDISAFERRAERLKQLGDLLFVTGLADEQLTYQKSTAIQTWLLGYEFPETIILSTAEKLYFLTSMKKSLILDQLKDQKTVKLEIFKRSKDPAANKLVLSKLVDKIGPKIGVVLKDVASGKSVSEWEAAFGDRSEKVDVSSEIAVLLSQKDESEMVIYLI
jgi:nucleosome binding factor SPN SPT16 subunit